MAAAVYRMKLFRCLTEPMHIAFNTNRGRTVRRVKGERELPPKREKPPPGRHSHGGRIHAIVHKATGPVLWRKTGRLFFAFRHLVRCRSPPPGLNFQNSD